MEEQDAERVRIDRWLWAARFFKTRGLAAEAVKDGRVDVNGRIAKPAKEVGEGDRVEILTTGLRRTVIVLGIAQRRGPATEAAKLYEETAESREAAERRAQERRDAPLLRDDGGGRPTKRDRRRMEALRGRRD